MQRNRRSALVHLAASGLAFGLAPKAFADTTQYRYDAQGRLVLVIFQDGSSVAYAYDAAGNRTQVVRSATTPADTFTATVQIPGGAGVNLRTLANTAGYAADKHANVTFQLASNLTVTGAAGSPNGGVAIDSGDWPITLYQVTLALEISGKAYGGGGAGGTGAVLGDGTAGGTGGDAIYCRLPMSVIVNSGGEVRSGGGGGGGGGGRTRTLDPAFDRVGGGGGGGFPNGAGGAKGAAVLDGVDTPAANGSAGTTSGGGAGGAGEASGGGAGRPGGGAGAAGTAGTPGSGAGTTKTSGAGGAAGYAVRKNGFTVPVTNNGTITGTQG
ncbi:MAG: RHS repeat protein [Hyphomonadaceae bacterium]|nr:RHS repeat protein [Hyphomonadaceae bacterium]